MMISPEGFIKEYEGMKYTELLPVRDELIEEIRGFENNAHDLVHPSPEVRYQCNLEYLGQLCSLISKKYNQEYVWCE